MSNGGFGGDMNRSAPTPTRGAVTLAAPGDLAELPKPPGPNAIPQCELTRKILDYDPKADTGLIDAAYDLAAKAHGTQRRENGDPYFTHPVAVANILAGYRLDVVSIETALRCNRVHDTPHRLQAL